MEDNNQQHVSGQAQERFVVDGKVVKPLHGGKVVVTLPENNDKVVVPLFCPMCQYPMKTSGDARSFKEHELCEMCVLFWGTGVLASGTGPDKESERWKAYMERRHLAFMPSIRFK